jgi:hypothetical protein
MFLDWGTDKFGKLIVFYSNFSKSSKTTLRMSSFIKTTAVEHASSHLVSLSEFRNYNETYYMSINGKWVYFHPSVVTKYTSTYYDILNHMRTYLKTIPIESIDTKALEIIKKLDIPFLNKVIKSMFEYVKLHVSNTAIDDSYDTIQLPVELTSLIYGFIPNDTSMDFINNIKRKILLPKNELITQLVRILPHIENTPEIIEIYCKYIDMFTMNNLVKILRDKFCDEFHEKKAYPRNSSGKFLPIFKCDDKIIRKCIYLNKTGFSGLDSMILCIKNSMEQSLTSEIKQFRGIEVFEKYCYFATEYGGRYLGNNSEIEIFTYVFDCGYADMFYKNDWRKEIPELLSCTTNKLTLHDIYTIKQYPVWVKHILENISENILKIMERFSKIEKYDRKMSVIERVEKLINLQNKYAYHLLQKRKNECRCELKTIEKFTK